MRKGGGKSKGAAFERECCRMLSLWVSHGKQEDSFWRSAMSGGRSTVAHAKGKRLSAQAGDITCTHPIGAKFAELYLCECKNYRDLNFDGLLTGKGKLIEFWDVLIEEANRYEKLPFLMAKQNRFPIMIGLTFQGKSRFDLDNTEFRIISPMYNLCLIEATTFFLRAARPGIGDASANR